MNIHCTDKRLYDTLVNTTIVRVLMGSHMYGLNHEESDTDYLSVFLPGLSYYVNPFKNHHQYQFKFDNRDEIFVDVNTFIQNLANGDSTINFECLFDEGFQKSSLSFLTPDMFRSYSVARSYLGFAKRDIKRIKENPIKKGKHILRGLEIAKEIAYGETIDMRFGKLKNLEIYDIDKFVSESLQQEKSLREHLNLLYNHRKIKRYLTAEEQMYISDNVLKLHGSALSENMMSKEDRLRFFDANENIELKYD